MLQANQNQALLPSEKPRPSPSKPPLRRYAAFTPKAGERLLPNDDLVIGNPSHGEDVDPGSWTGLFSSNKQLIRQ
jgi:hypothetical protein